MNSISFPKLFTNSSTIVVKDKVATSQDLKLLLMTECGEFYDDPNFGVNIRKYMYNQNNTILAGIIEDEIYSKIKIFSPQLAVTRDDITIKQVNHTLYAQIKGVNRKDFTPNMLEIAIFQDDER